MATSQRLVVFNAHMLRALIINEEESFPNELATARLAFQGRRFPVLITEGILLEYASEANRFPPFQVQPTLDALFCGRRAILLDEYRLERSQVELSGLPQEHTAFVLDAIAAGAAYLVTNRMAWLNLSEQTENRYGLQIVSPSRFVELEG